MAHQYIIFGVTTPHWTKNTSQGLQSRPLENKKTPLSGFYYICCGRSRRLKADTRPQIRRE
jgi:hypothetical protein